MLRTQISLDPEAHRRAKQRANELGISMAEYIRRLVDADQQDVPAEPASLDAVTDLGDGGPTDVAIHKDAMIGQAVAEDRSR